MLSDLMREGKIFIYPTDTIYGIGCDATNEAAVAKIRALKQRDDRPFSVIPPGDEWIKDNVESYHHDKLTWGPFTYFVFPKNQKCVAPSVRPEKDECSLGIRMSQHWFTEEIKKSGVPLVSTSVNISGKPNMTSLEDLDPVIRDAVDIIIYEGPKPHLVSKKIDLCYPSFPQK